MRRSACLFVAAASCVAGPAFATSTFACRSTLSPTDGPQLSMTVGTAGITQARLTQGTDNWTTGQGATAPAIAQSWFDRNSLRLVLVGANGETELARLETWRRRGWSYQGTLRFGGRTWQVRCSEAG
jgi:hypothetical protein